MKKKSERQGENWQRYVDLFSDAFRCGKTLSSEDIASEIKLKQTERETLSQKNKFDTPYRNIAICSPHPDDECLTGALPLRMLHENNVQVYNLAVTLGSDTTRRQQRQKELQEACTLLGFVSRTIAGAHGLDNVRVETRRDSPEIWRKKVESLVTEFLQINPSVVFLPHRRDAHPTHEGTHLLVSDALTLYSKSTQDDILAVENEFWHPNSQPNLLVGIDNNDLALLIEALTRHRGEICRNPYHLFLPARMMDNLRRGWELVRGSLEKTPGFCFAELYRVSVYSKGEKKSWGGGKKVFSPQQTLDLL